MPIADPAFLELLENVQVRSFGEVSQPLFQRPLHWVDALMVYVGLDDAVHRLVELNDPGPRDSPHHLEDQPGNRYGHFPDPPVVATAE